MIKKIYKAMKKDIKDRGFYLTLIMYLSNIASVIRGYKFILIYFKNIKASLFFIQGRSKFDIYGKNCKVNMGQFVFIRRNTTIRIDHSGELSIGAKTFINDNCSINCINKIKIGEYTKIGPGVSINDNDHNFRHLGEERMLKGEVLIGNNVWIGANSVILKDTIIEDNAVIAAGSIVKGHVPENSVYRSGGEKKVYSFI